MESEQIIFCFFVTPVEKNFPDCPSAKNLPIFWQAKIKF